MEKKKRDLRERYRVQQVQKGDVSLLLTSTVKPLKKKKGYCDSLRHLLTKAASRKTIERYLQVWEKAVSTTTGLISRVKDADSVSQNC